jgi:hypothetical protein
MKPGGEKDFFLTYIFDFYKSVFPFFAFGFVILCTAEYLSNRMGLFWSEFPLLFGLIRLLANYLGRSCFNDDTGGTFILCLLVLSSLWIMVVMQLIIVVITRIVNHSPDKSPFIYKYRLVISFIIGNVSPFLLWFLLPPGIFDSILHYFVDRPFPSIFNQKGNWILIAVYILIFIVAVVLELKHHDPWKLRHQSASE